jgi:UDP-glucose 4-epimerase
VRLIITGSSGQVGTNLALRCIERGHEILGIDCRPNPWTDAFPNVLADLRASHSLARLWVTHPAWARPDAVIHLAAHAKVHELVETPQRALENIVMTQHVLEACRTQRAPVVFASSREVYGDLGRERVRELDARFDRAASSYAASKISAESMLHAYASSYDMRYLVLRLSNVYGRYDNDLDRMERVVPLFIRAIDRGEPVTVFGADKVIDFTYIDDCVEGIVCGVERLATCRLQNETINLAYGQGHRLLELAEHIGQALGRRPMVRLADKRAGEVTYYVADIEKARQLLDFEPKVGLEEGVRRSVAWHFEWAQARRESTPQSAS